MVYRCPSLQPGSCKPMLSSSITGSPQTMAASIPSAVTLSKCSAEMRAGFGLPVFDQFQTALALMASTLNV